MKRFLLMGAASLLAGSMHAQVSSKMKPVSPQPTPLVLSPNWAVAPANAASGVQKTTDFTTTRWYNHAIGLGALNSISAADMRTSPRTSYILMWQDSTVQYPDENGNPSGNGIFYLSVGQVFHPQATVYTDRAIVANRGQQQLTDTNSYSIDSVMLLGRYERSKFSAPADTLIFTFVAETQARKFPYFRYTSGTVGANHGIDSFAAQLWSGPDYLVRPINQISYTIGGASLATAVQVKVPLTNATFADSTIFPDPNVGALHFIKCAPGLQIPKGCKTSVSVTFKSGSAYTPGDVYTNYNHFFVASHEVDSGGFVFYQPGDLNMSSVLTSDTSMVNATLGLYQPTIAYTSGGYRTEVHDLSFKVTCTNCLRVGIETVQNPIASVKAFPSPATNSLTVALTLKAASEATVSLSDASGKVVRTASFGKLAGGQQGTVSINTADLPSGLYFYTIDAAGQRTTDRVAVLH